MKKNLLSNGNKKIGTDTLIFNMQSATDCEAKKLGLCTICRKKCYALKAEVQYPNVLPYRRRQEKYWDETSVQTKVDDLKSVLSRKRIPVKYFRFNEAGDFKHLSSMREFFEVAKTFPKIKFYTYTHRHDLIRILNKNKIPSNVNINVSNKKYKGMNEFRSVSKYSKGSIRCKGDCRICKLCATNKDITIEVLDH